jgi:hypothetical protein
LSPQTDYYPVPGRVARIIFPSWNSYNSIHGATPPPPPLLLLLLLPPPPPPPLLLLLLLLLLLQPTKSPPAAYFWLLMDLSWILENRALFWIVAAPVSLVSFDMIYTTARKAGAALSVELCASSRAIFFIFVCKICFFCDKQDV